MSNWHKLQGLGWSERRRLMQALVLLPLMTLALRLMGLRRCQSALAVLAATSESPAQEEILAQQAYITARMVTAAARFGLHRATCLPQSLTLWWLLRRQGIKSDLRIGVRKEAGRFEAHAWVEHQGSALNDRPDVYQRFATFDRAILPVEVNS